MVFSSVILQRDHTVWKGTDIHRAIERRLSMWSADDYDTLIQEAMRCDKALRRPNKLDSD